MRSVGVLRIAVLVFAAASAACTVPPRPLGVPGVKVGAPARLRVRVSGGGARAVRQVGVEEYVRGSILAEFAPPAGDPATVEKMLEVQAVLSRTFAVAHVGRHARDGYDLCATTHCQLFDPARLETSRWSALAVRAAAETAGMVLWFDGAPATALYHADCGGHTSDPAAVWGGRRLPYLTAKADDGPAESAHSTWSYEERIDAIRAALNTDARTAVGARLDRMTVLDRDGGGRVVRVRLDGGERREVRGEVLRDVLTRRFGPRTLKSTLFTLRKTRRTFVFEGRGFGHGVGLCQAGALARVAAGGTPPAVLLHYFPNTKLVRLR